MKSALHLLFAVLLARGLVATAGGQEPRRALIVPVNICGSQPPVTAQQFAALLQEQASTMHRSFAVVTPTWLELADQGYHNQSVPPTDAQISSVRSDWPCTTMIWVKARFQEHRHSTPVSVSLATRLWVWRESAGQVVLDEPFSVISQAYPEEDEATALHVCALRCSLKLIRSLFTVAAQDYGMLEVPRPLTGLEPVQGRDELVKMCQAAADYATATDRGELMDALEAQQEALDLYWHLTPAEQGEVEKRYPGTGAWMRGDNFPSCY
ncbi:MAG: hypothetical protein ACYCW6_18640 [Candidatus Xenobia bacterium]